MDYVFKRCIKSLNNASSVQSSVLYLFYMRYATIYGSHIENILSVFQMKIDKIWARGCKELNLSKIVIHFLGLWVESWVLLYSKCFKHSISVLCGILRGWIISFNWTHLRRGILFKDTFLQTYRFGTIILNNA